MRRGALCLLPLLGGCQWIGNTADNLGEHLPVVGERCEHWQCITPGGQAASEAAKQAKAPPAPLPWLAPQAKPSS